MKKWNTFVTKVIINGWMQYGSPFTQVILQTLKNALIECTKSAQSADTKFKSLKIQCRIFKTQNDILRAKRSNSTLISHFVYLKKYFHVDWPILTYFIFIMYSFNLSQVFIECQLFARH